MTTDEVIARVRQLMNEVAVCGYSRPGHVDSEIEYAMAEIAQILKERDERHDPQGGEA